MLGATILALLCLQVGGWRLQKWEDYIYIYFAVCPLESRKVITVNVPNDFETNRGKPNKSASPSLNSWSQLIAASSATVFVYMFVCIHIL